MQIRFTLSIKLILIGLVTIMFSKTAKAQYYVWAKNQVGSDQTYGMATATDKSGNVFVTGNFLGASVTFGSITLTNVSNSFPDFYIVKYDPNGKVLWARSAGGTNRETGTGLATDANGNVFVTGWYASPSLPFGNDTLINTAQYFYDIFIVKYDANGNVLWARNAGGGNDDKGLAAATDGKGNLYVTGTYKSLSLTFGSYTINNVNGGSSEDIFLVKFDPSGNVIRAVSYGGFYPDWGAALATDINYNIYLAGLFYSPSISFGGSIISNGGQTDMYVVKFDSAGTALWAKSAGGSGIDAALSVAPDKYGNVYVSGYFKSSGITFGSTLLFDSFINTSDLFIVKYDNNGNALWAKSANGSKDEYGSAVVADDLGFVYLGGSFNSPSITLGTSTFLNKGADDVFLAKYDATGNIISTKSIAGNISESVAGMVIDANNNLFIAGTFNSHLLTFGNDTLINNGAYEMFVTKLSPFAAGIPDPASPGQSVTVFPNPSGGSFTITFPGIVDNCLIEINTILGEKIFSEPVYVASKKEIDCNTISSGIYFIKVTDGEKQYTKRIIVE